MMYNNLGYNKELQDPIQMLHAEKWWRGWHRYVGEDFVATSVVGTLHRTQGIIAQIR